MFMLVDQPLIFPARSLMGDSRGPIVDTGIELPLGGRVYVNEIEAREIARLFGFVSPEEAGVRDATIADLTGRLAAAEEMLAGWEPVVQAVTRIAAQPNPELIPDVPADPVDPPVDEPAPARPVARRARATV